MERLKCGGCNSREYFHRIFKEQQGMTPAQYQKS